MHTETRAQAASDEETKGEATAPKTETANADFRVRERAHRLSFGQEWNRIERALANGGKVALVPANQHFSEMFLSERFSSFSKTGASSESLKTSLTEFPARLANLWYSSYESPDAKVKVEFLRSATLCRYGEPDSESRRAANAANLEELVEAIRSVSETRNQRLKPHEERNLRLITIDLQSPEGEIEDLALEHMTTREQACAFSAWNGRRLVVGGQELGLAIQSFVLPTHEGNYCLNEGWTLSSDTLQRVREHIRVSLERAPRDLQEALRSFSQSADQLLARETQSAASPIDRFALAAHMVLFASLAGDMVHMNCRSGKDRTGYLDVEVKFLGYQLFRKLRGEELSPPGGPVLAEEFSAWKEILLEGGNHEIQELNSGFRGSKLDHGLLKERVSEELWLEFIDSSRNART